MQSDELITAFLLLQHSQYSKGLIGLIKRAVDSCLDYPSFTAIYGCIFISKPHLTIGADIVNTEIARCSCYMYFVKF